jgi:acetyltransferase-like isoleucine patch superfamily enzyme
MKIMLKILKELLHVYRLRLRFPLAVIYSNVKADPSSTFGRYSVLFNGVIAWESYVGNYSYVQEKTCLYRANIGPYCSIARNVTVGLFRHPTSMISTNPVFYDNTQELPRFFVNQNNFPDEMLKTVIEADVWIGEGVKVCAGVRIGVGSVIGAGAIVTRDIPPYSIAAGVPCRVIKRRFDDELCDRLLASAWWKLDEETLLKLSSHFSNPTAFLDAVEHCT